ncbi:hypothetical protein [Paenibacillus lignilyticus]|uniref:DUF1772 domain-containing protein n=1 Tax=Paenibacillus lignilyticus TaxID=1172615 RepID=A0ABS5CA46_9BACL|nr:hypothetical protein [Paenibacillus lignilyticus]MBP3962866.1 hypothetical protein [Paenibacillus lignilyticus]
MRQKPIALVILLALSALFFYGVDLFTMDGTRHSSGNGNPGLIAVALASSVYIPLLLLTVTLSYTRFRQRKAAIRWLIVLFSCCIVSTSIYGEIHFINQQLNILGDWDDPESKLYRFSLLNQYTNTFFFNGYTFVGGLAFALWVGVLLSLRFGPKRSE